MLNVTVRWWRHQGGWGFISCGACRGQRSWRTWSVVLDISKCSIQRCAVARICQYIWTCCMYRAKHRFLISFGCLWWVCACALFRSFTVLGKMLELNKCVEENVKTFPLDSCHYVWSLCKTNYWLAQMFLLLYRPEIVFQWCVWTNNLYTTFSYCCAVNILCPKENICLCIKMQIYTVLLCVMLWENVFVVVDTFFCSFFLVNVPRAKCCGIAENNECSLWTLGGLILCVWTVPPPVQYAVWSLYE